MLRIISKDYSHLHLDSHLSDLEDFYDFIYVITQCEELYDIQLFDSEAILLEKSDLSFRQLEDFIIFLKSGNFTDFIYSFIIENISDLKDIRECYLKTIRDSKIDSIISN
jgi:hypothetical protein